MGTNLNFTEQDWERIERAEAEDLLRGLAGEAA
jgi:hypothetical protein